jgi:hypothetical protein
LPRLPDDHQALGLPSENAQELRSMSRSAKALWGPY